MVLATTILLLIAAFILFLMFTAGHRRHRLEQALKALEKERMKLLKSIEHVKLSFYQKKLSDKEAQDKIFEYEEKLREVEGKILDLKEKPLMKTLKKQEAAKGKEEGAEEKGETAKEEAEVKGSERFALANLEAKAVVILFIIAILAIIIAVSMMGESAEEGVHKGPASVPLSARAYPTEGTPPGTTAGLRVRISNPHDKALPEVQVAARAPEGSGILIEGEELAVKRIEELESGGSRDLFYAVDVWKGAEDGEYVITVGAMNEYGLSSQTTAKLIVRLGAEEENV